MNYLRRKQISSLAGKVREISGQSEELALDVSKLVGYFKGEIAEEKLEEGISGKIIKLDEKEGKYFKIITEKEEGEQRCRFTIAHELGHLFIHMGFATEPAKWKEINEYVDSGFYRYGYSEEEYEANEFAGSLLMPEEKYKELVGKYKKRSSVDITKLASDFDVSLDATLTRGKWLGIFAW